MTGQNEGLSVIIELISSGNLYTVSVYFHLNFTELYEDEPMVGGLKEKLSTCFWLRHEPRAL